MKLSALSTHIPPGRIPAEDIIASAGGSRAEARVFRRMFGMDGVSCTAPGETLDEQFAYVTDHLVGCHNGIIPDTVIYVRGQPLQYAEGCSPVRRLMAEHTFFHAVHQHYEIDQHNCGGLFWALDLAWTLFEAGLSQSAAILGGDSHIGLPLADRYVPGCTLMGDAFCGLVVEADGSGHGLSPVTLQVHPEFSAGRGGSVVEMGNFFAAHSRIVRGALDQAGFCWDRDVPLLPHNVNRLAWQMFCRETGLPIDRVRLSLLPDIGHCYTCDPFLLLENELSGHAHAPEELMLISVGMGGFVGACTLHPVRSNPFSAKELTRCLQPTHS